MERPEGLLLFEQGATQPFMAKFMTPKDFRPRNQRMSNKATGGSPFKGRSHLFVGERLEMGRAQAQARLPGLNYRAQRSR